MTVPGAPTARNVEIAEESYHRCQGEAFLQAFYKRFLASDPSIPPRFAATDFQRQNKLLQHGIGLLLIYAKRPNPALLERIAVRHARGDQDIPPALYPLFVDALVATVREFDPQCDPAVEQAWREALAPGVAFMISMYAGDPSKAGG